MRETILIVVLGLALAGCQPQPFHKTITEDPYVAIALQVQSETIAAMVAERPELPVFMRENHAELVALYCDSAFWRVIQQIRGYEHPICQDNRPIVRPSRGLTCASRYWSCRACDPTGELPCEFEGGECLTAHQRCLNPLPGSD